MFAIKKGLLIAALFCVLNSCVVVKPNMPPLPSGNYPSEAKSTLTTVTVHVRWYPDFNSVSDACVAMGTTPILPGQNIVGCYDPDTRTIYAVEPRNFNDFIRLEILGHEFWHALGAHHP